MLATSNRGLRDRKLSKLRASHCRTDGFEVGEHDRAAEGAARTADGEAAVGRAEDGAVGGHFVGEAVEGVRGSRGSCELGEDRAARGGVAGLVGEDELEHGADRGLGGGVAVGGEDGDRFFFGDDELATDDAHGAARSGFVGARWEGHLGEIDREVVAAAEPVHDVGHHVGVAELVADQALHGAEGCVRRLEICEQAE